MIFKKHIATINPSSEYEDIEKSLSRYISTSPQNELNSRQKIAHIIRTLRSLPPSENVYMKCSHATCLPDGFNPQGNCDFEACDSLTHLPDGFNPQGNVNFRLCQNLIYLPEGFNPQGTINFEGCSQLIHIPDGFMPNGNVRFIHCINLTTIPESLFQMGSSYLIELNNTGLNASTIQHINDRQNSPGYNGPTFQLSINDSDFRSETTTTAEDIPELLGLIGHSPRHPLWVYGITQSQILSPWISNQNSVIENQYHIFRIGDAVEDILNLIYSLPDTDRLHKIDMRFHACCTLKDPSHLKAALEYIDFI